MPGSPKPMTPPRFAIWSSACTTTPPVYARRSSECDVLYTKNCGGIWTLIFMRRPRKAVNPPQSTQPPLQHACRRYGSAPSRPRRAIRMHRYAYVTRRIAIKAINERQNPCLWEILVVFGLITLHVILTYPPWFCQ